MGFILVTYDWFSTENQSMLLIILTEKNPSNSVDEKLKAVDKT